MSATPGSTSFMYVETDIPPELTIADYRAARVGKQARQRADRTLAIWVRELRNGLGALPRGVAARSLARPSVARIGRAGRSASGSPPRGAHGQGGRA